MSRKSQQLDSLDEPKCQPLESYEEIISFLRDPPAWRSLCKEMTPHSNSKIRNMSLISLMGAMGPDRPPTFCHFSPDSEDVDREPAQSLPKTLVCHDMANGYHDDSFIDGTSNHLAYTFYHWAAIDIFCYFSHHLITIPPVGWINMGHAHGVKVIGTMITEWTEGCDFWDFMLESESQYQELADALVSIAKILKFDGWLLNIENKVGKPLVLLEFVKYFHRKLHQELPDPELIWYDSVTIKGNLNWQNGLNEHNKDFFSACDGFFTNYSWVEEDVACSADMAGPRLADLYIGIDVWGRNFYGGGQFNTAQAVELAYNYGCSLALFAPAWTHEAADKRHGADVALGGTLGRRGLLGLRERALWGSLWGYLNTRLPCRLPFRTAFCQGRGTKRRLYGEVVSPGPWFNLRHMQYQPNSAYGPHGYLLSTPEKITAVSRHAIIKDKKGIIKYSSEFESSRHELHTVRSTRELQELTREQENLVVCTIREEEEQEDDQGGTQIKNTFKQMFRSKSKSRRNSTEGIEESARVLIHSDEEGENQQRVCEVTRQADHQPKSETHDDAEDHAHDYAKNDTQDGAKKQAHYDAKELAQDDAKQQAQDDAKQQAQDDAKQQAQDDAKEQAQDDAKEHKQILSTSKAHSTHTWHDVTSGWSMRTMSVHIKLGAQANKTRLALACVPGESPCLEPYYEDSYIGGSCLCVQPSDLVSPERRLSRLLHCQFRSTGDVVVCVVTKTLPGYHDQSLDIKLFCRDEWGSEMRVTCVGRALPPAAPAGWSRSRSMALSPLQPGPAFKQLQRDLLLRQPDFYISPENSFGWKVRYYIAPLGPVLVTSVNLLCGLSQGPVLLGHFGLAHRLMEADSDSSGASDRTRYSREVALPAMNQNDMKATSPMPTALNDLDESSQSSKPVESDSPSSREIKMTDTDSRWSGSANPDADTRAAKAFSRGSPSSSTDSKDAAISASKSSGTPETVALKGTVDPSKSRRIPEALHSQNIELSNSQDSTAVPEPDQSECSKCNTCRSLHDRRNDK